MTTDKPPSRRPPIHFMKEWRLARGMRQEDLAHAVGTGKSQISRYETGEIGITFDMQFRIMQALNIMPNEFFLPPPAKGDDAEMLRNRQRFFKKHKAARQEA
jgi:transcriptional regulator with XRE-family HTH domain